jgi:mono/diheme cytochrome c family protein
MLLHRLRAVLIPWAILFLAGLSYLLGWPWDTDMIQQPSIRPYQRLLQPPADAVPMGGEEFLPRNVIAERYRNPIQSTPGSLERGRRMFLIYCSPCHGQDGNGHGQVAQGDFQPPDLTESKIRMLSEATIYGTVTDGWLTMPFYRETMTVEERWDVVNYVRILQANK